MGVSGLSYVRHTYNIQELIYPSVGVLAFWLYIILGVWSLCVSWILGSQLLEYIYVLLILGPFMFSMPFITTSISSPAPGLVWTLVLDWGHHGPLSSS